MSDIRITPSATGKRLLIFTPYNADFVAGVKEIGGKWERERKAWSVDARDEERARDLVRDYFGTDGSPEDMTDLVTVRIPLARYELSYHSGAKAQFAGRIIAERPGRDSPVRLASGVVVVEGELPPRGGSMTYPAIDADGVSVEVRDIPRSALGMYEDGAYVIVSETTVQPQPEADQLRARRAELLAQVGELNTLLLDLDPEGEARRRDQERERLAEEIGASLRREHQRDKADAIRELVQAQQERETERATEDQRQREEQQRAAEQERKQPRDCRCGAHTCPPDAPTAQQYAQTVGRTAATVLGWCRTGKVTAVQHNGRWYVTADNH
ncbi:hypothetical protein [Actinacidiphila sp. ITFR-21]|uniref:hypothetical protein n=1 Tax=Actinacidiphila sp. ITFR-21 TaxID=3075199 RepID=UPI0028899B7F|nr:hypothetical protein [Streptomyces sp. ITFR-21]WNI19925.1 hypothetical protein RLT57_30745 [Streptomyces sp. ITFR-21]